MSGKIMKCHERFGFDNRRNIVTKQLEGRFLGHAVCVHKYSDMLQARPQCNGICYDKHVCVDV